MWGGNSTPPKYFFPPPNRINFTFPCLQWPPNLQKTHPPYWQVLRRSGITRRISVPLLHCRGHLDCTLGLNLCMIPLRIHDLYLLVLSRNCIFLMLRCLKYMVFRGRSPPRLIACKKRIDLIVSRSINWGFLSQLLLMRNSPQVGSGVRGAHSSAI